MVSKTTLKVYEFSNLEEYFDYISDSITNGQRNQAEDLISELSNKQRKEAYEYFNNDFSTFFGEAKQMVIEQL